MPPAKKAAANGAPAAATEVEALRHPADVTRRNIPTAETSSLMAEEEASARPRRYPRNLDLDPQLVWRGKDEQDDEDLSVATVPIYIQEKVLPEALIRDLRRQAKQGAAPQADMFGRFDRIEDPEAKLEFYAHAENWSNRMILGDGLLVMNSLAEKEGLRGQVQMIYLDPPYGIRFASNWQPSTRTREVKEGKAEGLSREPEQVRAFRDTWKDGVHSYLSFWRDRLMVARELLAESGSIFVQIGDENVHLMRSVMDEVFGRENLCSQITVSKTAGQTTELLAEVTDYILWYAHSRDAVKFREPLAPKGVGQDNAGVYRWLRTPDLNERRMSGAEASAVRPDDGRIFRLDNMTSQSLGREKGEGAASWFAVDLHGKKIVPSDQSRWKTNEKGMQRLIAAGRVRPSGKSLAYVRYLDDFPAMAIGNLWTDTGTGSFTDPKIYVVQTGTKVVQRCMLMTTDPGDLVLDPTCGSGTTAAVAEHWGRRWITVDTSRVALALARTRLMAARHPAYLLRDSGEGAAKEAEITGRLSGEGPFNGDIRQGFVLERVSHVTLKSIASSAEPGFRAGASFACHIEVHRQQCRDRRHPREVATEARRRARRAEHRPRHSA
jgi:adenine-specific DNA-methyltransferase